MKETDLNKGETFSPLVPGHPLKIGGVETENPIWLAIEIAFVEQFKRLVPLDEIRATKGLAKLPLLARGQRLSVQPVSDAEFAILCGLAERPAATKAGGTAKPKAKPAPKTRARPSVKRTP